MISDYYDVTGHSSDWSRTDLYGYPFNKYEITFSFEESENGKTFGNFRDLWKESYRELSQLIAKSRNAFRQRHRSVEGMECWRNCWPTVQKYCADHDLDAPRLEDEVLVWQLKAQARFLMALLKDASAACLVTD